MYPGQHPATLLLAPALKGRTLQIKPHKPLFAAGESTEADLSGLVLKESTM